MRKRRRLRDEPGDFWIGVGLIAEAPVIGLGHWLLNTHCATGTGLACDYTLYILVAALLLTPAVAAWLCNRLGLGARP